jgi:hypothetical protein
VAKTITFETVRQLVSDLEGVEVGTTYGTPALRVRGRVFACIANHRSAEPDTLVAIVGFDERDQLIEADPGTYYLKDHYRNYPIVLARLRRIHPDALGDLLGMAWTHVARSARARRSRARSTAADAPPARRRRTPRSRK